MKGNIPGIDMVDVFFRKCYSCRFFSGQFSCIGRSRVWVGVRVYQVGLELGFMVYYGVLS